MSDFDNTCVKCGCSSWIEVCENCNEQELENKRKQGALEELKDLIKVLDESFGMPKYTGELPIKYIKNRIKELEGSE